MDNLTCPHCLGTEYVIRYGATVYVRCTGCKAQGPHVNPDVSDDDEVLGQMALDAWSKQPWRDMIMFLRNDYSIWDARGCPACEYREGYFIKACKLHEYIDELEERGPTTTPRDEALAYLKAAKSYFLVGQMDKELQRAITALAELTVNLPSP